MKKTIYQTFVLAIVALVAMMLNSCGEDSNTVQFEEPNPDFIQVGKVTFSGVADGQSETIMFESPNEWKAEIHCMSDWLEADKLSGSAGKAEIKLSPRSDNYGITSRSAIVSIFVDGYKAYEVSVEQTPANTGGISVSGEIDESVVTLKGDNTGTIFQATINVTSTKAWTLSADENISGVLAFQMDGTPQNGAEKTIQVVVTADYAKFKSTAIDGKFYIKTNDGSAVAITVKADAQVRVFAESHAMEGETEQLTFQFTDAVTHGIYATDLYIESNVRWGIYNKPSWIETSNDWNSTGDAPTNLTSTGNITQGRQHIVLRVKSSELTVEGKTGSMDITDANGRILKTINLVFAGVGADHIDYSLIFPATDQEGNSWAFEAKKSTTEEGENFNRRRISMDFMATTSINYNSIADAPFHLILIDATNGIAHKKQVHWATLHMGNAALSTTTDAGMYMKQLVIEANERGDSDDQDGLTTPSSVRNAFVYIIPRTISFEDMWENDYKLKDIFADNLVLMSQKNDPDANYRFSFVELADGATIDVLPQGETKTYTIADDSYMQIDYTVESQDANGNWNRAESNWCSISLNDNVTPMKMTLTFSQNKGEKNPFTGQVFGEVRKMRIRFNAFIGDGIEPKTVYTIYANQGLTE